jgi:hypothetical protein
MIVPHSLHVGRLLCLLAYACSPRHWQPGTGICQSYNVATSSPDPHAGGDMHSDIMISAIMVSRNTATYMYIHSYKVVGTMMMSLNKATVLVNEDRRLICSLASHLINCMNCLPRKSLSALLSSSCLGVHQDPENPQGPLHQCTKDLHHEA